nr:Dynein light chain LC6, flagellar outer arm [Ipomoea batatas]
MYKIHVLIEVVSAGSVDAHLDSPCPALTKSKSQHARNLHREGGPIKKSHKDSNFIKRSNDEIKKGSKKEEPDLDVKRAYGSLSGSEEVKKIQKQVVKYEEVKRPSVSLEMGGREKKIHAVDCARKVYDSLEKFTSKALALSLKKEFDGVYGPAWHCIVGTSFGSFVTHSVGGFIYFSMDHKLYVLLFKTTVQRAD